MCWSFLRFTLLLALLLLTACSLPPLSRAELAATVFQRGDLPPAWIVASNGNTMVGDPDLRRFAVVHTLRGPDAEAEVSVGLYRSREATLEAFVFLLKTTPGALEAITVGEAGFSGRDSMLFQRGLCIAVLEMAGVDDQTRDMLVEYGRRLDERLFTQEC